MHYELGTEHEHEQVAGSKARGIWSMSWPGITDVLCNANGPGDDGVLFTEPDVYCSFDPNQVERVEHTFIRKRRHLATCCIHLGRRDQPNVAGYLEMALARLVD